MVEDSETSLKIYLREIRQTPLLTPQEEIEWPPALRRETKRLGLG
jgi:hypothetical protein